MSWGFGGLGLIVPGAGRLGWGASLITESLTPFILPSSFVLLLYCTWFVHGLYSLLVWVWFVVLCAWVRGGGWYVPGVPCVPVVGGGEKGKNSGGGCDNERKSSTPHMSDLNRAALGNPTTEILVA